MCYKCNTNKHLISIYCDCVCNIIENLNDYSNVCYECSHLITKKTEDKVFCKLDNYKMFGIVKEKFNISLCNIETKKETVKEVVYSIKFNGKYGEFKKFISDKNIIRGF